MRVSNQIREGVAVAQQLKTLERDVASTSAQLTSMKASLTEAESRTEALQRQAVQAEDRCGELEAKRQELLAANERDAQVRQIKRDKMRKRGITCPCCDTCVVAEKSRQKLV